MMLLTATNASDADPAASARLSEGVFRYNVTFDIPIHNRRSNAPHVLENILTKMTQYDANIKLADQAGNRIDIRQFPHDKDTFDAKFQPVTPRNKPNKLVLGVTVLSCF